MCVMFLLSLFRWWSLSLLFHFVLFYFILLVLHEDFAIYEHWTFAISCTACCAHFIPKYKWRLPKYKFKGNAFPIMDSSVSMWGWMNGWIVCVYFLLNDRVWVCVMFEWCLSTSQYCTCQAYKHILLSFDCSYLVCFYIFFFRCIAPNAVCNKIIRFWNCFASICALRIYFLFSPLFWHAIRFTPKQPSKSSRM